MINFKINKAECSRLKSNDKYYNSIGSVMYDIVLLYRLNIS